MKTRILSLLTGDGMKARAIRGTMLSFVGFGGSQVIRLASNLILTRILFPEAFGLMALVMVILAGLQMFSDTGLRAAIIQSKRGDDPLYLNTAWTVQIIRGAFLWSATLLLAAPAARFYEQEQLAQILPVLGAILAISGFDSTWIIKANRNMRLGPQLTIGLSSQVAATIVMILLALWLRSVWALVFGMIFGATLKMTLSHIVTGEPLNRFAWDRAALRELFNFGKYIFIATIAGYFVSQGDRLILGKLVSLETLAIFTIAFFIANVPQMLSAQLGEWVLFPLFRNRPPGDSPSNRRQIGRARGMLVGGFLGITAILAFSGEFLITFLYDPRYHDAGPLLVLLSLSLVPGLIFGGYRQILLANGNSRDFTILNIGTAVLKVFLLLTLIREFGVVGAILAPALADLASYPFVVYCIRRYHGWYPVYDGFFFVTSLGFGALALWLSPAARALVPAFPF